jgi:activator of HSP90 ATPase
MLTRTRRELITGSAFAAAGLALRPLCVSADSGAGISHSAESIHQEPSFTAGRKRLYQALTDPKQFDRVVQLSAAMQSGGMSHETKPTEISPRVGGAFSLFGGYIVGRHIELVPNALLVQAWRVGNWEPGIYSIARFEFTDQDAGTKIKFDHTGFPAGQAEHLAAGWYANYWDPLKKFLS